MFVTFAALVAFASLAFVWAILPDPADEPAHVAIRTQE